MRYFEKSAGLQTMGYKSIKPGILKMLNSRTPNEFMEQSIGVANKMIGHSKKLSKGDILKNIKLAPKMQTRGAEDYMEKVVKKVMSNPQHIKKGLEKKLMNKQVEIAKAVERKFK